jgi:hypothetical protein
MKVMGLEIAQVSRGMVYTIGLGWRLRTRGRQDSIVTDLVDCDRDRG